MRNRIAVVGLIVLLVQFPAQQSIAQQKSADGNPNISSGSAPVYVPKKVKKKKPSDAEMLGAGMGALLDVLGKMAEEQENEYETYDNDYVSIHRDVAPELDAQPSQMIYSLQPPSNNSASPQPVTRPEQPNYVVRQAAIPEANPFSTMGSVPPRAAISAEPDDPWSQQRSVTGSVGNMFDEDPWQRPSVGGAEDRVASYEPPEEEIDSIVRLGSPSNRSAVAEQLGLTPAQQEYRDALLSYAEAADAANAANAVYRQRVKSWNEANPGRRVPEDQSGDAGVADHATGIVTGELDDSVGSAIGMRQFGMVRELSTEIGQGTLNEDKARELSIDYALDAAASAAARYLPVLESGLAATTTGIGVFLYPSSAGIATETWPSYREKEMAEAKKREAEAALDRARLKEGVMPSVLPNGVLDSGQTLETSPW